MSKYNRNCDYPYWLQRQRAQSIATQKQLELLQDTLANGYSVPLQYNGDKKREKSVDQFGNNQISTCSFVKRRGSQYEAVPYYSRPSSSFVLEPQQQSFNNMKSINSESYKYPAQLHAGMGAKKPLEPYKPNALRSRLSTPDYRQQYYTNRSLIEIGDRMEFDNKHYLTTNQNDMGRKKPHREILPKWQDNSKKQLTISDRSKTIKWK